MKPQDLVPKQIVEELDRYVVGQAKAEVLEEHRVDVIADRQQFVEPALETEETHAASFKSLRLEVLRAAGDSAVQVLQSPPGVCAQIKGQDRRVHRRAPVRGRVTDATGSLENSPYVRARVARQSGNPSNPSLARIAQSSR